MEITMKNIINHEIRSLSLKEFNFMDIRPLIYDCK
jgi:hypothetical protein